MSFKSLLKTHTQQPQELVHIWILKWSDWGDLHFQATVRLSLTVLHVLWLQVCIFRSVWGNVSPHCCLVTAALHLTSHKPPLLIRLKGGRSEPGWNAHVLVEEGISRTSCCSCCLGSTSCVRAWTFIYPEWFSEAPGGKSSNKPEDIKLK